MAGKTKYEILDPYTDICFQCQRREVTAGFSVEGCILAANASNSRSTRESRLEQAKKVVCPSCQIKIGKAMRYI